MTLQTGDPAENKRSRKRASTCFVHTYGCVLPSPLLLLRVNFLKANYLSVRRTSEKQIKYYYRFQILYRAFSYNIIVRVTFTQARKVIMAHSNKILKQCTGVSPAIFPIPGKRGQQRNDEI